MGKAQRLHRPDATSHTKTLRHRLFHVVAATTPHGRRLHLDRHWPWTSALLDVIHRVRTAFKTLTVTDRAPNSSSPMEIRAKPGLRAGLRADAIGSSMFGVCKRTTGLGPAAPICNNAVRLQQT